jgi:histidine kinase family protein
MRSLSVEVKLAITIAAVAILAAVAGTRLASGVFARIIDEAALATVRDASDAFAAQERDEIEKLAATLDALLADGDLREAFLARDRARLLALAAPTFRVLSERDRITHWYFIEPEPAATVFLRVHHPELRGDRVERATLRQAVETQDLGAGKELGRTAFALRAVRPWIHEGKVIGYMELAEEIDHFLTSMKARTGDDYGLLVKKRFLDERAWADVLGPRANTWNDRPDVVVVDTTTFTEGIVDYEGDLEALPERGQTLGRVTRGDRTYVRGIFPVLDAGGRKVGGLFVLRDFTRHEGALRAARLRTFLALLGVAATAALAVLLLVRRLVFVRLSRLRRDLEVRATEAGLPPGRVVQLESEDEIGRLEALFRRVIFPARGRDEPPGGARDGAGDDPQR